MGRHRAAPPTLEKLFAGQQHPSSPSGSPSAPASASPTTPPHSSPFLPNRTRSASSSICYPIMLQAPVSIPPKSGSCCVAVPGHPHTHVQPSWPPLQATAWPSAHGCMCCQCIIDSCCFPACTFLCATSCPPLPACPITRSASFYLPMVSLPFISMQHTAQNASQRMPCTSSLFPISLPLLPKCIRSGSCL